MARDQSLVLVLRPEDEAQEELREAWRRQQRERRKGTWAPTGRRPESLRQCRRRNSHDTGWVELRARAAEALRDGARLMGIDVEGDELAGFVQAPSVATAHEMCCRLLPSSDAEALSVVAKAQRYYAYWRPEHVRVLLLAESHVYTSADDATICFGGLEAEYGGPRDFISLVYCLAYGESAALDPPLAAATKGTPQFWQLLAAAANDPSARLLKRNERDMLRRLRRKLDLLVALRRAGVWLLDVSVMGWYIPQPPQYRRSAVSGDVHRLTRSRPPKACKKPILQLSWELYSKHLVHAAADQGHLRAVVPIGMEVFKAIGRRRIEQAAPGAIVVDPIPAPNAWIPGGYGPFLAQLAAICGRDATVECGSGGKAAV